MAKFYIVVSSIVLCGCSVDLTTVVAPSGAFGAIDARARLERALENELVFDFERSSEALKFISSKRACTDIPLPEIKLVNDRYFEERKFSVERFAQPPGSARAARKPISEGKVLENEFKKNAQRLKNLTIFADYFRQLKDLSDDADNQRKIVKYFAAAFKAAASLTPIGPAAEPIAAATEGAGGLLINAQYYSQVAAIAKAVKPNFDNAIEDLKSGLSDLTVRGMAFRKAWEQCQDARFNFIKNPVFEKGSPIFVKSSGVELDSAFYNYRLKKDEYSARIQIFLSSLMLWSRRMTH